MTISDTPHNAVKEIASILTQEINKDTETQVETPETVSPEQEDVAVDAAPETTDESHVEQAESLEPDAEEIPVEASEEIVDTLNNLAEELDVPVTDLYSLNVNMSEGDPITLGSLKDFYEANRDIDTERQTLKEREINLQAESEKMQDVPRISNDLLQARAEVLSIQSQYNHMDWDGLRQADPGQYAALQSDFQTQFAIAKQNESAASDNVDAIMHEAMHHQQQRLFEAMPELKDEAYRNEVGKGINTYAAKYGFTPSDVANIQDNRLMRLLIEASQVDGAKTSALSKKVAEKEPISNGKAAPAKAIPLTNRKANLKRLTERAKASGDRRDQTAAVSALLT